MNTGRGVLPGLQSRTRAADIEDGSFLSYTESLLSSSAPEIGVFFSLSDLAVRKIHFDVEIPPGEIDFLDPLFKQDGTLKAEGTAEVLSHTLGEIRVRGHLRMTMAMPCDRCLEPASYPIDSDFDLFYRPADTAPKTDEVEIGDGEDEIAFYEGDGFELEEALREFVLLAMPMQRLCRRDCKGICPNCGQNRNEIACNCREHLTDNRWAALKQI